jgi:hypothetical protein
MKKFVPFSAAAVLVFATAGIVGHAESQSMDAMIESDRSDLEIPETYVPAPGELATDEEFRKAIEDQNEVAGEADDFDVGTPENGGKKSPAKKSPTKKKRKVTLAQPSGETFHYTDFGGMKPPAKLCSLFMDEKGNLNSYGRIVKGYINEEVKEQGSSRFLSDDLVGMVDTPKICPNWKQLSDDEKIRFWVWMFAATAFEESRCNAAVKDHFDINDYAVGLYQLERNVKIRGRRGPNCMVSAKTIHSPISNIRCAMDMIHYQLMPIADGPMKQSGRLYSAPGQKTNSYFYWLRQANGGEIGKHLRNFEPCGYFAKKKPAPTPSIAAPLYPFGWPSPKPFDPFYVPTWVPNGKSPVIPYRNP